MGDEYLLLGAVVCIRMHCDVGIMVHQFQSKSPILEFIALVVYLSLVLFLLCKCE
jgi:hypothetical protein